jgi:hypothetical protein
MKKNASHMKVTWSGDGDIGVFTRHDKCRDSYTFISDQKTQ